MRFVTRCPACRALFEVREKQLQACQGWLRCGQCLQAYDSTGLVVPWLQTDAHAMSSPRVDIRTLLHRPDVPLPPSATLDVNGVAGGPAVSADLAGSAAGALPPAPVAPSNGQTSASTDPATIGTPVAQIQRSHGLPRRTGYWGLACALATLLLAAQTVQMQLDRLQLAWPPVQQWGQWWCGQFACDWPAVRTPEAVQLDSARLIREGESLVLSLRVRNVAPVEVIWGALELSLLDQDARLLTRRVFGPQALGAAPVLPAGGVWEGRLLMQFEDPAQVQGFKAVMFLP